MPASQSGDTRSGWTHCCVDAACVTTSTEAAAVAAAMMEADEQEAEPASATGSPPAAWEGVADAAAVAAAAAAAAAAATDPEVAVAPMATKAEEQPLAAAAAPRGIGDPPTAMSDATSQYGSQKMHHSTCEATQLKAVSCAVFFAKASLEWELQSADGT
eukprot:CAMPEP_0115585804 /NCGR_PEP_ID=MMETSP0272-20121206/7380_1 /TAXON_ID=71861 /ORGANISM="Scrippsiella trochoidea, Strain CCMP3099" /LENGTH=158 /DNA_ID=CAMNT_0003020865 /DNA_START=83 /DNA_END=560 /DNA_ORIENTATION=-